MLDEEWTRLWRLAIVPTRFKQRDGSWMVDSCSCLELFGEGGTGLRAASQVDGNEKKKGMNWWLFMRPK